jgi:hypothetical protein
MIMLKLPYVLAALATLAVTAPTVASAEDFGVHVGVGGDRYRDYDGPRVYAHDHGWHRGWYDRDGDRTVVIRRHHYHDWDD